MTRADAAERPSDRIITQSKSLEAALEHARLVAVTDSTVLLTGETGTGKELVAGRIHAASARRDGVLVKVNCAALPGSLIESELFGHEVGAFTGAVARRLGRFERADGGTIFLDEIGDMPLGVQAKLLRVLQEGELERVGGSTTVTIDTRVIAATNRDLRAAVASREFRADLFYRLNVFPIDLPPLRERPADIAPLVRHFVAYYARRMHKTIEHVSDEGLRALESYAWPGNVRELQNVVERAVIRSRGVELAILECMPPKRCATRVGTLAPLEDVERAHILGVLESTNWRVRGRRGAAEILALKPTTLEARMTRLGLVRPDRSTGSAA